jgi:hypothetical protein
LRIINKHILGKLIRKNRGNSKLVKAVQQLISEIEDSNWETPYDLPQKDLMLIVFMAESFISSTSIYIEL